MGKYTLSGRADSDIQKIARDSIKRWGLIQAEKSVGGLHEAFNRLAEFPDLGWDVSHICLDYRRWEIASHSVFYRKTKDGILIIRVLHERMDFERHL